MLGRKSKPKKKKSFSTKNWHLYGFFDISDRDKMMKEIRKLRKNGFKVRYRKGERGRYRVEAKEGN